MDVFPFRVTVVLPVITLALALLLGSFAAVEAVELRPSGDSIVSPDAKLELLYTRSVAIDGGLTEGPAVAPDGTIYFTDIPFGADRGMILQFDPRTRATTVFTADSGKSNGLMFDADGDLVACQGSDHGGRAVVRWNVETATSEVLVDSFDGKRLNAPNDLVIDSGGRIYFTDPRYVGTEPRELEHRAVYRLNPDGKIQEITHNVEKPNGIVLSPDERTLYVADHNNGTDRIDPTAPKPKPGAMKIYAFPLDADGLATGERFTLVDFGTRAGCDGMTIDSLGNVYITLRDPGRPGVLVIDSKGTEVAFIPTGPSQPGAAAPVGLPSNCCFGRGDESHVLYITVDLSLYRIPLNVTGHRLLSNEEKRVLTIFRSEFVPIEVGSDGFASEFMRGRDGGPSSEGPASRVRFETPFSVAAYEVHQNLWTAVMGRNPSRWQGARNSVEMVSFDAARTFCARATALLRAAGLIAADEVVRLPSEAEWEYCARAGTTTTYSFGDGEEDLTNFGWYRGNAKGNDPPVGAKLPNPWQLYDVHGYLWEWCEDVWHDTHDGAPVDGSARHASGGSQRVLRGGSWKDSAVGCTSTARRGAPRDLRDDAVGFRCVLARTAP